MPRHLELVLVARRSGELYLYMVLVSFKKKIVVSKSICSLSKIRYIDLLIWNSNIWYTRGPCAKSLTWETTSNQ